MIKILISFACAFAATLGFAIFLNIPRHLLVRVGLVGGIGWTVSSLLIQNGSGAAWAYLVAAFAVAFLAESLAIHTKNPSTLFSIPGIYPLVPGYALFQTMFYFTRSETDQGLDAMINVLKNAGAIALGIIIVYSLGNLRKKWIAKKNERKPLCRETEEGIINQMEQ